MNNHEPNIKGHNYVKKKWLSVITVDKRLLQIHIKIIRY